MSNLVPPHGGQGLKPLLIPSLERSAARDHAASMKAIPLTSRETSDLLMLGMGAYTPLDGFMTSDDWRSVCTDMKLANGLFWPIPITLSADTEIADRISLGDDIALRDAESDEIMGVLTVTEKYPIDKILECENVFRSADPGHPGVAKVMAQGPVNLAGPVVALNEDHYPETYAGLYLRPSETRAMFEGRGWSTVAAFQTRNPMHRSHEYLVKVAIEICDGVLIHQVLGALKPGDIPAEVRVKAIDALVHHYFVHGTILQSGYPIEMRYAGPREALLHAVFRQNFGCSHLLVGRDHAGIGDYYGPFDAHHIFDTLPAGSIMTEPLKIDITFFCESCDGMATAKTCPHEPENHINISGTKQREMLSAGEDIPPEFSRPEVVKILRAFYAGLN